MGNFRLGETKHRLEDMSIRRFTVLPRHFQLILVRAMSGEAGSGAGRGGGSGGSIRDAGGAFGKMEAAHEEEYFRKQRAEQLKQLKEHDKIQEKFHESQIKVHEEAIKAHKKAVSEMKGRDSDSD